MSLTVVSAPGKVLLAGGYLVLDPKYSGVVVSTSSRFYTVIQESAVGGNEIRVRSPQFLDATWVYSVQLENQPVIAVKQISSSAKNKFVQLALERTLALALEIRGTTHVQKVLSSGLNIAIVGDNDFYSQRAQLNSLGLPSTIASLSKLQPFSPLNVTLSDVHKTGLGSSAALITSLVTALLLHFSAISHADLESDNAGARALAHNVSQYVHCLAQGKVGSGFDVSSAVFGSQVYTRFDPSVIQPLMIDDLPSDPMLPVLSPSNRAWDYRVEPFNLPPMTRLMLADVDAGSDTPSLVGKVLKWRQSDKTTAATLWDTLSAYNVAFGQALLKLSQLCANDKADYVAAVQELSSTTASSWGLSNSTSAQTFAEAYRLAENMRAKMREMGELAGVPIEPHEQTNLLDACLSKRGVIAGGVPGAGGYDAIWLLVFDSSDLTTEEKPLDRVESVWTSWKELDVSPLVASESFERGLRIERVESIPGLAAALESSES